MQYFGPIAGSDNIRSHILHRPPSRRHCMAGLPPWIRHCDRWPLCMLLWHWHSWAETLWRWPACWTFSSPSTTRPVSSATSAST